MCICMCLLSLFLNFCFRFESYSIVQWTGFWIHIIHIYYTLGSSRAFTTHFTGVNVRLC